MEYGFCEKCWDDKPYFLKKDKIKKVIRDKEYEFIVENAYCKECGARVSVFGLDDKRAKAIDDQYREIENIVTMDEIGKLKNIYDIGSGPLSLALGFGEVTMKRFSLGAVPSKEYSDIIRKALESPTYFKELLEKNKDKLNSTAYKKAKAASEKLCQMTDMSDTILATVSYIFYKLGEVTPLALQKLLYFIQGHYMLAYGEALFTEDCLGCAHGPIYKRIYNLFKEFKYHVIEDQYYAVIKNRHVILDNKAKGVIDLVLDTYGLYNAKTLEKITRTHMTEHDDIIEKSEIENYYKNLDLEYNIKTKDGILKYINTFL